MAWTFEATEAGYTKMWRSAMVKAGADATQAETFANKIIAAEQRYKAVQASTGVPWYFIGALHMRESSCNFAGVLHNGDRIIGTGGLTTRVPAGRGPFATWEASAVDALKLKDMQRVQAWSAARMLYQAEVFNGLGYVGKGTNSPYVWAGTNHEQLGKYIRDHVWDPTHDDTQLGVAAVLIRLATKRPDIHADLYPAKPTEQPVENDDLIKEIKGLRAELALLPSAIASAIKGEPAKPDPAPEPTPAPAPVTAPSSTTPILDKPGVGTGIVGLLLSALLQWNGGIDATEGGSWGQLLPILSAGLTGLGATGMVGSAGGVLSAGLSWLVKQFSQKS